MKARIAVLPGDGIGAEVTAEAVRCLHAISSRFGHDFELVEAPVGAAAMAQGLEPLPPATLALAREADAVLFGAVGSPRHDDPSSKIRPEQAILGLRRELGLFANLRPVVPQASLRHASPLKDGLLDGVDFVIVRELTGGLYFGRRERSADAASDECRYTVPEIERITRVACRLARGRRGRITSIDKANVLETSRLWREVVTRIVRDEFPDVSVEHQLVDSAAMRIASQPAGFDVIVTENLFGDILSDEAAAVAGSIGVMPSASIGEGARGLYEPIHGSAPDIAGRGIANPYGAIASAALLLRHSLGLEREASQLETAMAGAITAGVLTADLARQGVQSASTRAAGEAVFERI